MLHLLTNTLLLFLYQTIYFQAAAIERAGTVDIFHATEQLLQVPYTGWLKKSKLLYCDR